MRHPKKLNAAMIARLAEAVGRGLPDVRAASLCGISPRTLKAWRAAGRAARGNSLLARLNRELERADAEFMDHHLQRIARAGAEGNKTQWTASAWLLERRHQSEFALIQRVETGEPGAFSKLTADEVKAKILQLVGKPPRAGEVKAGKVLTEAPKAGG